MKYILAVIGGFALLASFIIPQLLIISCPLNIITLLVFMIASRHEREDREAERHRELVEAARRGSSQ